MSCALALDVLRAASTIPHRTCTVVAYLRRCLSKIPTPSNPHLNVLGLSAALVPKFPPKMRPRFRVLAH